MNDYDYDRDDLLAAIEASGKSGTPDSDPLLHPAPGQFHPLAVETDMWEAFVLVLETDGDTCQVIPGSMDPIKGGPSDILIPAPGDSGRFWTLDLGLKQEIRTEALRPGFAKLSPGLFDYVKSGLNKYGNGETLGDRYRFCLPYIGESDSRRKHRNELADLVKKAGNAAKRKSDLHGVAASVLPARPEDDGWGWSAASVASLPDWFKSIRTMFAQLSKNGLAEGYAFAAGDEKKSMPPVVCRIENHEEILSLKYSPSENAVRIDIFTADKSDFSGALDGSEIVDSDECALETIRDGRCLLKVGKWMDSGIALRTPDGMVCRLKVLE
jgi:hypothetical protein